MWIDKLNRVCMMLIYDLKTLDGEAENGQPSQFETNYLVTAAQQKCLEKGAPFERIENDENLGRPFVVLNFETDPNQAEPEPAGQIFEDGDPFVQKIGMPF